MEIQLKIHPAAEIFPRMSEAEYEALKADIAAHGVREPVWIYQDMLLDGRHRQQACDDLGIDCPSREFTGNDPLAFVWSLNGTRRHLTESQRAVVGLRMANLTEGRPKETAGIQAVSQQRAADLVNVSRDSIQRAKLVERDAPELLPKVEAGEITLNAAVGEIKKRERVVEINRQKETLAQAQPDAPQGLFHVIVMDPPWPYREDPEQQDYDPNGRRAANPYPEMQLADLAAMRLPAADDCVLWLWTTHKFMRHAFPLLDRWGFTDRAIVTWSKDRMGLGRWLRSQSEFCIMATRGQPVINLTNQTTVLHGPMREHSRKPDEFYTMVDALCVGRKLDFFSREPREGWEQFGNDTQRFAVG